LKHDSEASRRQEHSAAVVDTNGKSQAKLNIIQKFTLQHLLQSWAGDKGWSANSGTGDGDNRSLVG